MLGSEGFRQLLIADIALTRGVASARDVAYALQGFWEKREAADASVEAELRKISGVDEAALAEVVVEVDRMVAEAGGNAQVALTRHGGLDRSIHVALSQGGAGLSMILTRVGAGVRSDLREMPEDRYVDFEVAGEGGMGIVYMTLDTELSRLVAFKMIRPDAGSSTRQTPPSPIAAARPQRDTPASRSFEILKARFLQEAWVTGGLEHPGIVPVYELGQTQNGIPYYTMRFVRGQQTLKNAIDTVREGPVEDRLHLLEPFLKVCDTIRYAHSRGVIHRDLKPDNAALGQFGEVVLLDWGLAKLEGREDQVASKWQERVQEFREAGDLRTVASAIGTPGYMSPEAATGRLEQVDQRSDVYSLGVVLYEILTGKLPFEFRTYAEYLDCVSRRDAPHAQAWDASVPQALSDLAARSLDRDRTKRPKTVEDLSRAIRSWQAASAIEREVEGLLRDAKAALDAAEEARADDRLRQVERAAGALSQVAEKRPENATLASYGKRADALREAGIREREKASGRRLLVRGGITVLALAVVVALVVIGLVDAERRRADEALDDVMRLADSKRVADLVAEADLLWPLQPERAGAMAAWLERARAVLENRADHVERLERLRAKARPYTEEERLRDHAEARTRLEALRARLLELDEQYAQGEVDTTEEGVAKRKALEEGARRAKARIAQLKSEVATRKTWTFPSEQDAWMHQVLTDLMSGLDVLDTGGKEGGGVLATIERRHALVTTLGKASIDDHGEEWEQAIEAIATSPKYGALKIVPQLGLVPLGPDPQSGLYEFAHLGSGSPPVRDAQTKRLVYLEDTAIVFVLIPHGAFQMGAQAEDPSGSNYDRRAEQIEGPVHSVTLGPLFIAKHECTQSQWAQLTGGERPSASAAGETVAGRIITDRNPVEQVSWVDATKWLSRHRLRLPSEAEWEYACRAETSTPWIMGRDVSALDSVANIADVYLNEHRSPSAWSYTKGVNDGHAAHAPVGTYQPNAFGLYDMHGNVWEWCEDWFGFYVDAPIDGSARSHSPGVHTRISRGGGFDHQAWFSRSSFRSDGVHPDNRRYFQGFRPARSLDLE